MIRIGFFDIHLYGVLVGVGILVGFWVAARMASKFALHPRPYTLNPDDVWNSLWWVFVPAMVGARIYHVVDLWDYYRVNPMLIPAIWTGGLGIFGGIVGGVVGLLVYCWWECSRELRSLDGNLLGRKRLSGRAEVGYFTRLLSMVGTDRMSLMRVLPGWKPGRSSQRSKISSPRGELFYCTSQRFLGMLDLAAFGLPLGQAIGRWGNFFNQELFGKPTDLPWSIYIPLEKRLPQVEGEQFFHPLFLYESLFSVLVFGLLLLLWRARGRKLAPGSYFAVYLMLYGIGRFLLEGLRLESWTVGGFNVARAMSVIFIFFGLSSAGLRWMKGSS